jgi:hypothetical protein
MKHYIRVTSGPYSGAIYEFAAKKDALALASALEKLRPHSTDYGNDRDRFPETHLKDRRPSTRSPLRAIQAQLKKKRAHATKTTDAKPRILKISRPKTFAGQRSITANVQYLGESPARVEFVGPSASIGGAGPVVMITRGHQTFVHDPSRFGNFGPDWVRRFFESA